MSYQKLDVLEKMLEDWRLESNGRKGRRGRQGPGHSEP